MTNTIASTKCPSTLPSGKYGMSQHLSIIDDSKEYIFVKLTDSALRSIEEYQCTLQARRLVQGQRAQIQFIGNGGIIHFPVGDGNAGRSPAEGRKFGFAIDDVEGSLECIQQKGSSLDVLGSLNYRMRIHANDDVYDTTRTKMAIAEETEKSKCIREIKPNQTDIGRKIKRPLSAASVQAAYATNGLGVAGSNCNNINGNNSNNSNIVNNKISRNKLSSLNNCSPSQFNGNSSSSSNAYTNALLHSSPSSRLKASVNAQSSPNPTVIGGGGTIDSNDTTNTNNNSSRHSGTSNFISLQSHNPSYSAASTLSTALTGGITTGYQSASNINSQTSLLDVAFQNNCKPLNNAGSKNANSQLRGKGSGRGTNSSCGGSKSLDVSRRKLRERLIHLLALKPFKKPELFARLQNEGISQRDRNNITNLLKDISTLMRDNTYNLKHNLWNNVDENWPYFSEQERQQLKRRKPQNLTPPNSSDAGSTTSGQSPTSHTGSPPPQGVSSIGLLKRTRMEYSDLYESASLNGVQPKKQRISHYKKNALETGTTLRMLNSNGNYTTNNNSSTYSVLQQNRDSSPFSPNNYNNMGINQLHFDGGYSPKSMLSIEANSSGNKVTLKEKRFNCSRDEIQLQRNDTTSMAFNQNFVTESQRFIEEKSINGNINRTLHLPQQQRQQQTPTQNDTHKSMLLGNNNTFGHNSNNCKDATNSSSSSSSGHSSRHYSTSINESRKHSRSTTPSQIPSSQKRNRGNNNNSNNSNSNANCHQNNATDERCTPKALTIPSSYEGEPSENRLEPVQNYQPQLQEQHQQQQFQQQQQSLPTEQEIADVANSLTMDNTAGDTIAYDFSNYTTITTVEQRRRYRSDFESEYGEYLELSATIGSVQNRFREMGERMATLQPNCRDYYKIKNQIIQEYENLRKEQEAINKNNERLNYLGAKLGYIKQLVAEFDKKVKAGEIRITPNELRRDKVDKHQETTKSTTTTPAPLLKTTTLMEANLSPMVQSASESNCSPPIIAANITFEEQRQPQYDEHRIHHHQDLQLQNQQQQRYHQRVHNHQHHHHNHHHHHQRQSYQQHHEPETIDVVVNETTKSDQKQNNSNSNIDHEANMLQYQQLHNNQNSDSDSDDSSSSSSSDDDDDDDSNDGGGNTDDDGDSNNNDDYDDNDGDHNAPY